MGSRMGCESGQSPEAWWGEESHDRAFRAGVGVASIAD
jgi:hypothetical protein